MGRGGCWSAGKELLAAAAAAAAVSAALESSAGSARLQEVPGRSRCLRALEDARGCSRMLVCAGGSCQQGEPKAAA